MLVVALTIVIFCHVTGPWSQDFSHRVTKLITCPTHERKFSGRHTDLAGQHEKNVSQMFADSITLDDLHFYGFTVPKMIKLAEVVGVMREGDHAYSIQNTW